MGAARRGGRAGKWWPTGADDPARPGLSVTPMGPAVALEFLGLGRGLAIGNGNYRKAHRALGRGRIFPTALELSLVTRTYFREPNFRQGVVLFPTCARVALSPRYGRKLAFGSRSRAVRGPEWTKTCFSLAVTLCNYELSTGSCGCDKSAQNATKCRCPFSCHFGAFHTHAQPSLNKREKR